VFPSLHTPGTLTFFLVLGLVFLLRPPRDLRLRLPLRRHPRNRRLSLSRSERRAASWPGSCATSSGCSSPTTSASWWRRSSRPTAGRISLVGGFYGLVAATYFGTFFLAPVVGNRAYCRFLCPFGATFGLINHAGCYDLKMDAKRCIDCGRCEQACDMGIPVWTQGKEHGRVTGLEDCMGCARCVVSCPTDALEIRDVRNLLRPALRQDATHLLRRVAAPELPRIDACAERLSLARDPGPGRALPRLRRADLPRRLPAQ
jgi:glutamate synthase (NADPH/NADH) small chain